MPKTVANAVNEARTLLQDVSAAVGNPLRYSTADLLAYFNDALTELRRLRPDAFLGTYEDPLAEVDVTSDMTTLATIDFPVDVQFFTPVVFYMAGMAELRDDEFTVDGRAVTLMSQFTAKVTGGDVSLWQRRI